MATAHLNPYARIGNGQTLGAAQCFLGRCVQPRVDIATVPATRQTAPDLICGPKTNFLTMEVDAKVKIFAGAADTSADDMAAHAVVTTGYLPIEVQPGDVVHVWLA